MKRILEIDSTRGIAAVIIVLHHLWFPTRAFLGSALDLFFVMSGYLITGIILKNLDQPGFLINFFARRSLRIWPIYYLSLLLFLAVNPWLPKPSPTEGAALFLTYTQNVPEYWGAPNPPFAHGFHHTWTLAIEEQFYVFWPLALALFGRKSLIPLALGMIGLAVSTRMSGISRWVLMTKCDGLALGALLAVLMAAVGSGAVSGPATRRKIIALGVGSVAYLALSGILIRMASQVWPAIDNPLVVASLRVLATNLMFFSFTGLLVLYSGDARLSGLRHPGLVLLGQMSYGIYLYHYILFDVLQDFADRYGLTNRLALDGIKIAASLGLAYVSWWLVEEPLLRLKDRFQYRAKGLGSPVPRVGDALLDQLQSRVG